jgi:hypothetical protein
VRLTLNVVPQTHDQDTEMDSCSSMDRSWDQLHLHGRNCMSTIQASGWLFSWIDTIRNGLPIHCSHVARFRNIGLCAAAIRSEHSHCDRVGSGDLAPIQNEDQARHVPFVRSPSSIVGPVCSGMDNRSLTSRTLNIQAQPEVRGVRLTRGGFAATQPSRSAA